MNQFQAALYFYKSHTPLILDVPKNEWAGDPYAWSPFISLTPIEQNIWSDIRDANIVMYPQYPIEKFFVDFANPRAKVVMECDGYAYHLDKQKDKARDIRLQQLGWTVYRITGRDCNTDFDEETMTKGYARQLVESIGELHQIKRVGSPKQKHWEDCHESVITHILKMNPIEAAA